MLSIYAIHFRGASEQIPPVANVQQLIKWILTYCSPKHLAELAPYTVNTAELAPLIRSRVTKLERRISEYDQIITVIQDSELNAPILQNKHIAKLLLLQLRKLYLSIYHSSLLPKASDSHLRRFAVRLKYGQALLN